MKRRHAILITLAALILGACAPHPERATIVPLDEQRCWVVEHGRLTEERCP